jgi:hypothetical protein
MEIILVSIGNFALYARNVSGSARKQHFIINALSAIAVIELPLLKLASF